MNDFCWTRLASKPTLKLQGIMIYSSLFHDPKWITLQDTNISLTNISLAQVGYFLSLEGKSQKFPLTPHGLVRFEHFRSTLLHWSQMLESQGAL